MRVQCRSIDAQPYQVLKFFATATIISFMCLFTGLIIIQAQMVAWSATSPLITPREFFTMTMLQSGKVLVTAGQYYNYLGYLTSTELYDPLSGTWSAGAPMTNMRLYHTATRLQNGKVLVVGGYGNPYGLSTTELYDPVSKSIF